LDERVKVIIPVAGHSPIWQRPSCRSDIGDLEQNPTDLCAVADYDTLTALLAPRPTLLIYNRMDDCCFRPERTRISVYEPVRPLFDLLGVPDHIEFYENLDPGTHNYDADNRSQLYRFLNKHFGLNIPEVDLPYEDELLSESQLEVGLSEDNATLLSLAKEAAKSLPRLRVPKESAEWTTWLHEARGRLENVIRLHHFTVRDMTVQKEDIAVHHLLRMDDIWTVTATELHITGETKVDVAKARGEDIQVLLSDEGRTTMVELAKAHLTEGRTVIAADVFGTGESRYPSQYQMMLAAVGERPLGVMVGQILALLKWAASGSRNGKVKLAAVGPVTSFASLCAAALEPKLLAYLYLNGLYDSLKRLIELPIEYDSAVPLFCFGLLKELDVPELLAMTEDLPIERHGHGPVHPVISKS